MRMDQDWKNLSTPELLLIEFLHFFVLVSDAALALEFLL